MFEGVLFLTRFMEACQYVSVAVWNTKTLLNHTFSMVIINQDFCVLLSKQAQKFGNLISFTSELLCRTQECTMRSIIEKALASACMRMSKCI